MKDRTSDDSLPRLRPPAAGLIGEAAQLVGVITEDGKIDAALQAAGRSGPATEEWRNEDESDSEAKKLHPSRHRRHGLMDEETELERMAEALGEASLLGLLTAKVSETAENLVVLLDEVAWDQMPPPLAADALEALRKTEREVKSWKQRLIPEGPSS